jgi:hypothetical protein
VALKLALAFFCKCLHYSPAKFQYPMQLRQAAPLHHAPCAGFHYAASLAALAGMKLAVTHNIPA